MNFIHNPDYKKIFFFHATIRDRVIARESGWLEFKIIKGGAPMTLQRRARIGTASNSTEKKASPRLRLSATDGQASEGEAEKFIEWAKSEHLSFWK